MEILKNIIIALGLIKLAEIIGTTLAYTIIKIQDRKIKKAIKNLNITLTNIDKYKE